MIALCIRSQLPIVHKAAFQFNMIAHPLSHSSAVWICVSVSVSSSGAQSGTQFAPGFMMMIDYLSSVFLLMKNEGQGQSLNYTLLYIKKKGFNNPFPTLSRCHVTANNSFVHIIVNSRLLQPS